MKLFLDFRRVTMAGPSDESAALLPALKQEIIDGVYMRMMGFGKNRYLIRQLHQLQKDSILLLNVIHSIQQDPHTIEFYNLAQQYLIEILESLNRYKGEYFNRQQAVPHYLVQQLSQAFGEKLRLLETGMNRKKIEPTLQAIVLSPLLNFGNKGFSSYQQMEFLLREVDKWISLVQHKDGCKNDLLSLLLHNGFNTTGFNQYYILKIANEVHEAYQIDAQFEVLFQYRKELTLMPKKPYRCYDSLGTNTRETVLKFVDTELIYLNRKQEFSKPKPVSLAASSAVYRIKTSLSVDGFAYLIRLLIESEAIEANPRTELMEFLAAHVQTRGKENGNLSANSFNTKYKQVTQSTAIGIRSLLVKMVRKVETEFSI